MFNKWCNTHRPWKIIFWVIGIYFTGRSIRNSWERYMASESSMGQKTLKGGKLI